MTKVTAEMVKELRERTGIGMGKCKEALDQSHGNMELAIENLRKAGMASAVKKEGRETKEGLIGHGESKNFVSIVEVNSETDFVAQNDKFKQFLKDVSQEAAEIGLDDLSAFVSHKSLKDPTLTIDQYRSLTIQSLGENIQVRRLLLIRKNSNVSVGIYSHMGGKIVTAVELTGGSGHESLARDIAMHIAAESPDWLNPESVPSSIKAQEEEIAKSQLEGKPAQIIEKILQGKMKAFYDQACLVCQKYVKDSSITIQQLVDNFSKTSGKKITIARFIRWKVGETI